ncbi:Olfactory receptor 2J2 [Heterocephalus glaber]|uniref:Olfactory receptor 2J2 n=1 Tax=Heterocephalus glaber TaxID=10181 RepID=G5BQ31_HETGA|nr:Olfactory receptor 2J2 [Heterocephalus glaber]
MDNISATSEGYFILLGFSRWPQLEVILFLVILIFYSMTRKGNPFIIILSHLDARLHTPIYSFLSNFSFLDLCYTTELHLSVAGQLLGSREDHFFCWLHDSTLLCPRPGNTEGVLLVPMSYVCLAVVCRPLHYTVLMTLICTACWLWTLGQVSLLTQRFSPPLPSVHPFVNIAKWIAFSVKFQPS